MENSQQLVSNYVRAFVENEGGTIHFVPKLDDDGRMCWEIYGVLPDGRRWQVKLSKTGRAKILKSSDAVISYWQSIYPRASEVTIPILPVVSE